MTRIDSIDDLLRQNDELRAEVEEAFSTRPQAPPTRRAVNFRAAASGETYGAGWQRSFQNWDAIANETVRAERGDDISPDELAEGRRDLDERLLGLDRADRFEHMRSLAEEAGAPAGVIDEIFAILEAPEVRSNLGLGAAASPRVQAIDRGVIADTRTVATLGDALNRAAFESTPEEIGRGDYSRGEDAVLDTAADIASEAVADAVLSGRLSEDDFSEIATRQYARRTVKPPPDPRFADASVEEVGDLLDRLTAEPPSTPKPIATGAPAEDRTAAVISDLEGEIAALDAKRPAKPGPSPDRWKEFF